MDLEAKEKQISELMASHPSSISSSSSSIEEEEEDEVVDSVDVESSLSGKRVFVRCRRVATDVYDDDHNRDEPVALNGKTTMRAGEASVTVSNLSLNMSRDSGCDIDSGSDADSECEDFDRTPDGAKKRSATIPPLNLNDYGDDDDSAKDGPTETRIERPLSAPALSRATTTMFTYDSHSTAGRLRRLSLCSASDGDADDDVDHGQFAETVGRPQSARIVTLPSSKSSGALPAVATVCGPPSHQTMLFPELSFHQMDAVLNDSDDSKDGPANTSNTVDNEGVLKSNTETFDGDFPVVTGIEIDGNWFNKKTRAVIEWKGDTFKRKMAVFKWLSKMILLNSTVDRISPEYPDEIPSPAWRRGYLRKRKNELNLYLIQCHSLPWIRRYKP